MEIYIFKMEEAPLVSSAKSGKEHTLSETHCDWKKIEPVTMKANFIQFWCVESEFIGKN